MLRSMAVIACVLAACGKGKSKADCRADVDDLMKFLRAMDHDPPLFQIDDDLHLVPRPELPAREARYAPAVEVRATGFRFEGAAIERAQLGERLAMAAATLRERIERGLVPQDVIRAFDPHRSYVLVDAAAPWRDVVDAMQMLADVGLEHPTLVFAGKPPIAAPPHTWVDDELAKIDKHGPDTATAVAKIVTRLVSSCQPVARVYGAVAGEAGDKAAMIIEGTGEGLIECNCDADLPALRSAMYAIMANPHPIKLLPLELARDGTLVELPAATPWRDAAAKLTASARVWLAAK